MKCPENKKHGEMYLYLGRPGDDVGWKCKKCTSTYWDLTEQEMAIWKNGYLWGNDSNSGAQKEAEDFREVKRLLGIKSKNGYG